MSKIIGLITARGGSKGIPKKNIIPICGKPLIQWSIESALNSVGLNRVIVSTDNPEIAKISDACGAETPFLRPKEFAEDNSAHVDVVIHAINWLKENEQEYPEYVMLLQPTSPLRDSNDIDSSIEQLKKFKAQAVTSVCETHQHPYLMRKIRTDGTLENFIPDSPALGSTRIRRQVFPQTYFVNGAIFIIESNIILTNKTLLPPKTYPYIMSPEKSIQIDSLFDIFLVECILKKRSFEPSH